MTIRRIPTKETVLWCALLAAMAGDILISWALPLFCADYSCMKMPVSALGSPLSPVRLPFDLWMLLEGVLFLVALPALFRLYRPVSAGIAYTMAAFVAAFAVGMRDARRRETVVAARKVAVPDANPARGGEMDAVAVGNAQVVVNGHALDINVLAVREGKGPARGIDRLDVVDSDMAA